MILWPFKMLWQLAAGLLSLTGHLVALVLGIVFLMFGFLVSATIIGMIIGIPLMILGMLLIIRGLF